MKRALAVIWVVVTAAACGDDAACREACDRPYAITEREGEAAAAAWSRMPEPLATESKPVAGAWRATLREAREAYVTTCLPECERSRPEVVQCRRLAGNLGEWKRCSDK